MRASPLSSRVIRGTIAGLCILSVATATPAAAQDAFTGRLVVGAFMPSGELKDQYSTGGLLGLEGSYRINERFAATASSTWANSGGMRRDNISAAGMAWSLNIGAEAKIPGIEKKGAKYSITPYAGVGGLSRAYYFQTLQGSTTGMGFYGAVGADVLPVSNSGLGVRAEVRMNNAKFSNPDNSIERKSGTDLMLTLGLTWW